MASITEITTPKLSAVESALDRIAHFFEALRAGQAAAADYERLSGQSTEALARKGLTREGVARAVLERNFG